MPSLKWTDADEIGFQLSEKLPNVDPLTVLFTDLRKYALELDEFSDDPKASNEATLEAIQMSWLAYYHEIEGLD